MSRLLFSLIEVAVFGYLAGVPLFFVLGLLVFHRGVARMANEAKAGFLITLLLIAFRWPLLPFHNRGNDHG